MEEYQQRVIEEKIQLDEKLLRLHNFLSSDKLKDLDLDDQNLLVEQEHAMKIYSIILWNRINRFGVK